MSHDHSHTHKVNFNKAFLVGIILNSIFIAIEAGYGIIINSMALLADAGHNLSDVLGLILAWGATVLAKRSATNKKTYGMKKSTILAALFNSIILLIAVGAILLEAIKKISNPEPVLGSTMMLVAGIGVVINMGTALFFVRDRKNDININGAFLHMAADAAISLGVVLTGFIISKTNWYLIDPILSIIIAIVITYGTWDLLKESFNLAIDAVPKNIKVEGIKKYIENIDGVLGVHDLHVWGMSTTENALTAHVEILDDINNDVILKKISNYLEKNYSINHLTIQFEKDFTNDCKLNKFHQCC